MGGKIERFLKLIGKFFFPADSADFLQIFPDLLEQTCLPQAGFAKICFLSVGSSGKNITYSLIHTS